MPGGHDPDQLSVGDWRAFAELREWIGRFAPDVVHFHHYFGLGVEAIVAARIAAPQAIISLTLHEMLAICAANGQMVKPRSREICRAASPEACRACLPDRRPAFFSLREGRVRAALDQCDAFVFPSRFLAEVYRAWGLPAAKCAVIPNGVVHPAPEFDRTRHSRPVNRFGFFGQMIDNKGLDVAMEALLLLARGAGVPASGVEFQINGANRHYAAPAYLEAVDALRRDVERSAAGRIRIASTGAYRRDELAQRMGDVDWVVAPSTWGEAFGLVISEAWMFGRLVIATAIGAFGERIRDGVDGLTFPLRDARALADRIAAAAGDEAKWLGMSVAIAPPWSDAEMFAAHLELWRGRLR